MGSHVLRFSIGMLGVLTLSACGEETPTDPTSSAQPTDARLALAVAGNTWITRANLQDNRHNVTLATVTNSSGQSVVYAIGGYNPDGFPVRTVTAYNVATNTWHFRHALPVRLAATNGAGVVNGKIYVSGGITNSTYNYPSNALYMYDPITDTWTRKRDMPSVDDRYHTGISAGAQGLTGVINGKLYVVTQCYLAEAPVQYFFGRSCYGGTDATVVAGPAFLRYDPAVDRWDAFPSSPWAWVHGPFAGGVIAGKLYVMGSTPEGTGVMAAYDPGTKRWTTRHALGLERPGAATAVLNGKLYVIGGRRYNAELGTTETLDKTRVYDPTTNLWGTRAPLPTPRADISGTIVRVNGQARIEVIGGTEPGNNLQYVP